jgi:hypothetical protein
MGSLIKKRAFTSLERAISLLGGLATAPTKDHDVELEYVNYMEEFVVQEDGVEFDVVCMWGSCDYFIIHNKDPERIVIKDGAHDLDPGHCKKLPDDLLELIQRCAFVGWVPVNLLNAIRHQGRELSFDAFCEIYGELIEYVEDMLERFDEMVDLRSWRHAR